MKTILQNNEEDCLLACYAMILSSFGCSVPIHELFYQDMLPADGLSVSYLQRLNNQYKLNMKAYRVDIKYLQENRKKINYPYIIHWDNNHFVIVKKIKHDKWIIVDPALGQISYKIEEVSSHFSNLLIYFYKEKDFKKVRIKKIYFQNILNLFDKKFIIKILMALFFVQGSVLLFSILIRYIMQNKLNYFSSILLMIFIILIQTIGMILKNQSITLFNQKFDHEYTNELFLRTLNKPILFFRNQANGIISEKINLKTTIRDTITTKIIPAFISLFSSVILFVYLATISYKLTIIVFLLLLMYCIFSFWMYKKQNELNNGYIQYLVNFNSEVMTDLEDIDYIKISRKEKKIYNNWKSVNKSLTDKYSEILRYENLTQLVSNVFNYVCLSLIIILGIYFHNYLNITVADIILYQTSISLLISSLDQVKNAYFEIYRLQIYLDKQSDLLKNVSINKLKEEKQKPLIKCMDLNFSYFDRKVYSGVNLEVFSGEKIAILGESGSGKSTLLLCLAGVLRYTGTLSYGIKNFYQKFGVVLQNMTLKSGTIIENLECENIPWDEVSRILQDTNVKDVIDCLPNKILSRVLKQGKNFSGGQIQKLLIAKSLLGNKDIIFWDEAFSNLDESSKQHIYNNILKNNIYSKKTMLIVSHQLDIIPYLDYIIYIDKETGTVTKDAHENLMINSISYRNFITQTRSGEIDG
ncbi:peptidase domain-containing ABC transporter [Enterococcus cecorum]|nr:peptidase domain-containing ABC transporter [Enterococcus cecorum]CAI3484862.1 peptidase domain-containing ABC transporter [Enterococcus cecorum]